DDYAHHPTEIRSILLALRKAYPNRRLMILFQPHRYTRTKTLDFSEAFEAADLAIITDIYSAGEKPILGVNGQSFCKKLKGDNALFLSKDKLLTLLPKMLVPGDVLVTAGAGDITEIGPQLLRQL
ncbi:MAG: glutamate ligase domain-containing protein, partial [Simkaniaceae bacterium]